jgi:hypothetical protein
MRLMRTSTIWMPRFCAARFAAVTSASVSSERALDTTSCKVRELIAVRKPSRTIGPRRCWARASSPPTAV